MLGTLGQRTPGLEGWVSGTVGIRSEETRSPLDPAIAKGTEDPSGFGRGDGGWESHSDSQKYLRPTLNYRQDSEKAEGGFGVT